MACQSSKDGDQGDDVGDDTADDTHQDDTVDADTDLDPDALNRTVPDVATPAPEFVATNRDGAGRAREDLLGHPTVMWFYPAAATGG